MSTGTLDRDLFVPRPPPGMRSGFGLAVVAHVLLVLALAWSVNWKASEPEGVVAELWSALPQAAAPRAAPPVPQPPTPTPTPTPVPQSPPPVPRAAPPQPDPAAAARRDAQIAVEQAREQKLEREREEAARQQAKRKAEAARREAEAEAQKKRLADEQADKKKQADKARLAEASEAKVRETNLRRARLLAGSSDEPAAAGTATRTSGPSASYAGRIKARIKPNIVLTGSVEGNPTAEVEVRVAPDGTITGRKITRSSGSSVWDETVLRAIDKTEILPRDTDGRVAPVIAMTFRPIE